MKLNIEEYLNCDDIHIYNKNIVKNAMKDKGLKLESSNYFRSVEYPPEYYF